MRFKRRRLLYGVMALAATAATVFAFHPAEAAVPIDQAVQIRPLNFINDGCLDADLNTLDNASTMVQIFSCHGRSNQNWIMEPDQNVVGFRVLNEIDRSRCLDIDREGLGRQIQFNPCDQGDSQLWEVIELSLERFQLANRAGTDALAAQGFTSRVILAHNTAIVEVNNPTFGSTSFRRAGVQASAVAVDSVPFGSEVWQFVP